MPSTASLGTVLPARRMVLNLTQEDLARRIGIKQSDVSRLERDRVALPRRQRLEAIAAALEMPFAELLLQSGWYGADSWLSGTTKLSPEHIDAAVPAVIASTGGLRDGDVRALLPLIDELRDAIARSKRMCAESQRLHEEVHKRWRD